MSKYQSGQQTPVNLTIENRSPRSEASCSVTGKHNICMGCCSIFTILSGLGIFILTVYTFMTPSGGKNFYDFFDHSEQPGNQTDPNFETPDQKPNPICDSKFFMPAIKINYEKLNNSTCIPKKCFCPNGIPFQPGFCPVSNGVICQSCDPNYELVEFSADLLNLGQNSSTSSQIYSNPVKICLPASSETDPVKKLEKACQLDLNILIDGSASIKSPDFQTAINFAQNLVNSFKISGNLDQTRLNLAQFSNQIKFYLDNFENSNLLIDQAFDNLLNSQMRSGTNGMNLALNQSYFLIQNTPSAQDIPQYVVLITGGAR